MKKDAKIDQLLDKPIFDFQRYHAKSKMKVLPRNINPKNWPEEWINIYYKGYSRFEEIALPKPKLPPKLKLEETLRKRKSIREFSKIPVNLNDLSTLLYYSAGMVKSDASVFPRRFYPSPGGRFAIEVYFAALNTDLSRSIYHYYVKKHSLEKLFKLKKENIRKLTNQHFGERAGLLLFFTAVFNRNAVKYGERAYRHVLVEAGHMAQNFYLVASALNLGVCGIGGYSEYEIDKLLELDGINETVIYVLAIGNK